MTIEDNYKLLYITMYFIFGTIIIIIIIIIIIKPFMPSGLFYLNSLDRPISYIRDVWLVFIIIIFSSNF